MKRIGILSDTHGYLDPALFSFFENCDEIWHAGDWGEEVAPALEKFKPIRGVYGNIDDPKIRSKYPEYLAFNCEGVEVLITHIAGYPGHYAPAFRKKVEKYSPQLLICGHSHICKVEFDRELNCLYMNPGAVGQHGFHQMRTLLLFDLDAGKITNLRVVELGKRGSLNT
jgi:putative phosphoesterase